MAAAPSPEDLLRETIARLRDRARLAAAGEPEAPSPPPEPAPAAAGAAPPPDEPLEGSPRHWQEEAEERALELRQDAGAPGAAEPAHPTVLQVEVRALARREGARARLRRLLADGRWHGSDELVAAGGLRFGARLLELRRGLDGRPPLDVDTDQHDGKWRYRIAPAREA